MQDGELEELFRRWAPIIYQRCLRLLAAPAAAEDATQEVFLKLMAAAEGLDPEGGYAGWIYRVATNHCLNVLRDEARLLLRPLENLEDLATISGTPPYPERDLTLQVLRRFDEETRAIAVFSLVDGMTRDEVAEVLGISRKTVGAKLARFLTNARKYLARMA